MSLLEIEDLRVQINGSPILQGVSMEVWKGYVHAIAGPNGAGKSTLAHTIMGLEGYRRSEGDIRLEGESILPLDIDARARRGITFGWQEPARYEGLPLRRFVTAGAAAGDEDCDALARRVLAQVGLAPDRYIDRAVDKSLSGGERKKLELASILAMQPKLVLLDEPDSGIDVESLRRIREAIELLRESGSTVLLITHSLEVLSWAEHAFLMCCGAIVAKGTVDKIRGYFENRCIPCDHKNRPQRNAVEP